MSAWGCMEVSTNPIHDILTHQTATAAMLRKGAQCSSPYWTRKSSAVCVCLQRRIKLVSKLHNEQKHLLLCSKSGKYGMSKPQRVKQLVAVFWIWINTDATKNMSSFFWPTSPGLCTNIVHLTRTIEHTNFSCMLKIRQFKVRLLSSFTKAVKRRCLCRETKDPWVPWNLNWYTKNDEGNVYKLQISAIHKENYLQQNACKYICGTFESQWLWNQGVKIEHVKSQRGESCSFDAKVSAKIAVEGLTNTHGTPRHPSGKAFQRIQQRHGHHNLQVWDLAKLHYALHFLHAMLLLPSDNDWSNLPEVPVLTPACQSQETSGRSSETWQVRSCIVIFVSWSRQ